MDDERFYDSLEDDDDEPLQSFYLTKSTEKETKKPNTPIKINKINNNAKKKTPANIRQNSKIPVPPLAKLFENNNNKKQIVELYENKTIINNNKTNSNTVKVKETKIIRKEEAQDFEKIVPLYTGDLPKNKIYINKKKVEKSNTKPVLTGKIEKSYLSMYYEKVHKSNSREFIKNNNEIKGSNTSRAVCGSPSPKEDIDPDLYLAQNPTTGRDSDEYEEFYKKFMECEIAKRKATSPYATSYPSLLSENPAINGKNKVTNSKSTSRLKPVAEIKKNSTTVNNNYTKLELLKKRQEYGKKMSMINRIKLEEIKALKHIKTNMEENLSNR